MVDVSGIHLIAGAIYRAGGSACCSGGVGCYDPHVRDETRFIERWSGSLNVGSCSLNGGHVH